MAATGFTPIQLYRTSTAAAAPTAGNLADGELAINLTDEKLYFKNAAGAVKLLASTAGSTGDVVGPASATNNALAAFDGTTGKLIKNASLTANNVLLGNGTGAPLVVAPGTSGNVLSSNGTTWTSAALPAGGLTYVVKTANYTTKDKEGVLADTSGGAFTVTLPATPATGAQVVVADAGSDWGTNNLTVARNGSTIGGLAEDLVCDITGASVQFVYDGTTWEVYAQIGGQGGNVATLDGVQTLTNKTLTDPKITLGGTNGTAGQAMVSQGTGLAPVWSAVGAEVVRVARTSNTALAAANKGNLIDITSGTFTQTFVAAATLGDGWFAYIQNSGTGDITLDPDGSETIDGLTSYIMYPGEVRLVQCDGTAFFSVVLTPFFKTFTASGTFAKPPGYSKYAGLLWGAGGSGRKDTASNDKCGGGGGACAPIDFLASSLGATEAVTIGAGGAAVAGTANGNAGGYSEFAGVYAYGGYGGTSSIGYGGSAFVLNMFTTDNQIYGGGIGNSDEDYPFYGGGGANLVENESHAIYGGAAGGTVEGGLAVLNDQTTIFGGAGGLAVAGGAGGTAGTAPGGGGGATRTGTASGAGARGELRIWGVA